MVLLDGRDRKVYPSGKAIIRALVETDIVHDSEEVISISNFIGSEVGDLITLDEVDVYDSREVYDPQTIYEPDEINEAIEHFMSLLSTL